MFVAIAASMLCVVVVFTSESRLSDVSHIPENNLRFGDEDAVNAAFVIKFSFSAESFPTFPPLFSSVPEFATSFDDTFDDNGATVVSTNVNYNDASDQWLGNEWSRTVDGVLQESSSNSMSVVSMLSSGSKTSAWTALESEFAWLDWDDVDSDNGDAPLGLKYTDIDGDAAYATSVKIESGSFTRMEGSTSVTETRKHLISNDDYWNS